MGHKKIAYIHGQQNSVTKVRLASFYRTMEEHELSVPDEYVPEAPYLEAEASAEVTKKLLALKNPPTCILYPDDYTAIGGIAVIREAGLSIPSDISVAGYDWNFADSAVSAKAYDICTRYVWYRKGSSTGNCRSDRTAKECAC